MFTLFIPSLSCLRLTVGLPTAVAYFTGNTRRLNVLPLNKFIFNAASSLPKLHPCSHDLKKGVQSTAALLSAHANAGTTSNVQPKYLNKRFIMFLC